MDAYGINELSEQECWEKLRLLRKRLSQARSYGGSMTNQLEFLIEALQARLRELGDPDEKRSPNIESDTYTGYDVNDENN